MGVRIVFCLASLLLPLYAETLCFPQYGDGGGLSTTFTVMNFSTATATGSLKFYDSDRDLQPLPLSTGTNSQVSLSIPPRASRVIRTAGTSSPVKNGYAVLELSQEEVSEVAILLHLCICREQASLSMLLLFLMFPPPHVACSSSAWTYHSICVTVRSSSLT